MEQYVRILGSLYYPGQYDLAKNEMLSTLISNAKPTFEAKTDIVYIERTRPDNTIEFLSLPFPGYQNAPDFKLEPRDVVHITNLSTYRDVMSISVLGNVRQPFTKTLALNDRIKLSQAIEFAGGLKQSAYPVAYIFRHNLFNSKEVKYIRVDLEKDMDMLLQPGDKLNIYDNETYSNIGEIRISGAVKSSRSFTFDPSMTLQDLITNAGGFNVGAAYNRVEVFRTILSPTEKVKMELITLQVDSSYKLIKPKDFNLQPYDHVVVRMTPEFYMSRTVELNGEVKYPGIYVLEGKETTLADIIKKAGGLLGDADPYGTKLFRTYKNRGNISLNIKSALFHPNSYTQNPILFEGDVINVNRLENTVTILETGTRMAQYSINTDDTNLRNIVYQGRHSAKWYIRNYAGGFQKNADRNSVVVTYPNNQMQSTKRVLVFFNVYPIVEPGSTITMKMDPDKIEAETKPKDKIDWESNLAKGLSTLMSTLSIILLLQRL
jgi:protein involved in polysaccharide export with SLBB domain